jgi:nucleoside-triphosphatase
MIYILSGDIRTGKTTSIYQAAIKRNDVGGFLTPDLDGTRILYDLFNRQRYPFQVEKDDLQQVIHVGRFTFLVSTFTLGSQIVLEQATNNAINYIVVDEVGKLELKNEGFHSLVEKLISMDINQDLILVIRSFLVDEIIKKYQLEDFKVIHDINLVLKPA